MQTRSSQRRPQLLLESGRDRIPATGKGADHHPIGGVEFVENAARHMPQTPGHPVSLHRGADGFGHHQADAWTGLALVIGTQCVHDKVGLHRPHPLTDRGTEFRRTRHPVARRKHRARSCVESRSQRAASLATPVGHDRPAGPGPHPQPEAMHPRAAPVVGLKSPLALGHGCLSSFVWHPSPTPIKNAYRWGRRLPLLSSSVSLASRRGLQMVSRSQPYHLFRATVRGY